LGESGQTALTQAIYMIENSVDIQVDPQIVYRIFRLLGHPDIDVNIETDDYVSPIIRTFNEKNGIEYEERQEPLIDRALAAYAGPQFSNYPYCYGISMDPTMD
jgi:hypothetical protein